MAPDPAQTARGALAGMVAAGVWAAQQPLDRRVFKVPYDDTELLGKLVTRRRGWPVIGLAMHLINGAIFGAVYANLNRRLPLPSWARGPAAGLGEHVSSWPLVAVTDRLHPARDELPTLGTSPRAFLQATWRHLLFGAVLGELERRLNHEPVEELPSYEHVAAGNGHVDLSKVATAAPG